LRDFRFASEQKKRQNNNKMKGTEHPLRLAHLKDLHYLQQSPARTTVVLAVAMPNRSHFTCRVHQKPSAFARPFLQEQKKKGKQNTAQPKTLKDLSIESGAWSRPRH